MNLDLDSLAYIKNVVETAQVVGIDNIVIEPEKVRAINDEKSVVLFQDQDVPDLGFSVGLNRVGVFLNRLDVAKTQDNFAVTVKTNEVTGDEQLFARGFEMKAKGFKVDYRCANPKTIAAPKRVNDEMIYKVTLTPQAVYMLQKGQSAMGADMATLICKDGEATFELTDVNSDKFTHTFTDNVVAVEGDTTFTYKYPLKILLQIFKQDPEAVFQIGRKGMLNITVNTLNLYVLPQV